MIHHVTREIPPPLLDGCIAFYAILGFERVPVPPGIEGRAVWLEHGERDRTQIHLMPTDEPGAPSGHIGVVCRDFDHALERLERERAPEERERHPVDRRREHWGSPRVYVRDPAGHLVEVMAWPPHESGPAR